MAFLGLDVHLYASTLLVLNRCGGDLETVTIQGGWHEVFAWLRQRRRVFLICCEASAGYGPCMMPWRRPPVGWLSPIRVICG